MFLECRGQVLDEGHLAVFLWLIGTYRRARRTGLGMRGDPTWGMLSANGVTLQQMDGLFRADLIEVGNDGARPAEPTVFGQEGLRSQSPRSRIALTAKGRCCLERVVTAYNAELEGRIAGLGGGTDLPDRVKPSWRPKERQLWFGITLVKELCRSAPNQEAILDTFERLGWPGMISDPLAPDEYIDPRERVSDTVRTLNRGIARNGLRFFSKSAGQTIGWKAFVGNCL